MCTAGGPVASSLRGRPVQGRHRRSRLAQLTFRRLCLMLVIPYVMLGAALAWRVPLLWPVEESAVCPYVALLPTVGLHILVSWRLRDGPGTAICSLPGPSPGSAWPACTLAC